jgi:hypothetical protein
MNASRSKIGVSSVEGDVEEAAHENRRVTVAHPLLYSISIVPGGLLFKSYSTLHTPPTSFTILVLTLFQKLPIKTENIRRHKIRRLHRPQTYNLLMHPLISHNTYRSDRQERRKRLGNLVI